MKAEVPKPTLLDLSAALAETTYRRLTTLPTSGQDWNTHDDEREIKCLRDEITTLAQLAWARGLHAAE